MSAGISDLRTRRIPNWLTLPAFLLGILLNGFLDGVPGVLHALGGFVGAFLIYFLLYTLRAMGAGDVKLMAAVGAVVGWSVWLRIFLVTAILGGICAIVLSLWTGRLRQTLWNVRFILVEIAHLRAPYWRREDLDVKSQKSLKLPHGAVIAVGALAYLAATAILAR